MLFVGCRLACVAKCVLAVCVCIVACCALFVGCLMLFHVVCALCVTRRLLVVLCYVLLYVV